MAPSSQARIVQIDPTLHLIILPVALSGFDDFIGCWVSTGSLTLLVDPGPASSTGALMSALAELGIQRPDLVLFTHIHIDHAGAAGILARHFPKTTLVCHPKAVAHLCEPEHLWQGTLKTLGRRVATAYAPFEPVPSKAILAADQLHTAQIAALSTPGHAPHHYAYVIEEQVLFAGEAAGICLPVAPQRYCYRPTTPPRFFLDTYLESLDLLVRHVAPTICYGHLGWRTDPGPLLDRHRSQILAWKQWITPWFEKAKDDPQPVMARCIEDLLVLDPLLADFQLQPAAVQQREREFMANSIRGYWGHLAAES